MTLNATNSPPTRTNLTGGYVDHSMHIIQRGDTLWGLARAHGLSVKDLVRANPEVNARHLQIGHRLNIPSAQQAKAMQQDSVIRANHHSSAHVNTSINSLPLHPHVQAQIAANSAPGKTSIAAAQYADVHHLPKSEGKCYHYVKEALQHSGAVADYIPGIAAKDAGPALETRGFINVLNDHKYAIQSPYDAPVGAVLIYGAAPGVHDKYAKYGHIEMRTESGFASDYASSRARTGAAANGLQSGGPAGRQLIGVYIKPDIGSTLKPGLSSLMTQSYQKAAAISGHRLGDLSMIHETSHTPSHYKDAAGVVSSGIDDKGGKSYGAYQLASKTGDIKHFLNSDGAQWKADFAGMDPTRAGAFEQKWKDIAKREPEAFFNAQHEYIKHSHFDPVVKKVLDKTGINILNYPSAVQDAVWSMSVQHGKAAMLVTDAVLKLQAHGDVENPKDLINALYDRREAYVVGLGQGNLLQRYHSERKDALAMLN